MKITIEPTRELYNARINDTVVPVRMWRGRTDDGIEVEAYLLAIAPVNAANGERLRTKFPTGSIRIGGWPSTIAARPRRRGVN